MDDFYLATAVSTNSVSGYHFVTIPGLKISSFTGPSDKMSDDLQFSLTRKLSLNDTNEYQHNVLILNGKCCEDIK